MQGAIDFKALALIDLSRETQTYEADLLAVTLRTARETDRFKAGETDFDHVAFWHKTFVRTFFTAVDGTCFSIRRMLADNAERFGLGYSNRMLKQLRASGPHMNVYRSFRLAFAELARAYGLDFQLDLSGSDWRGFARLAAARARVTHPKRWQDVYPFDLFPCTNPGIEWYLHTWHSLLDGAIVALKFPIQAGKAPERRFHYTEDRVDAFEDQQRAFERDKAGQSWIQDLGDTLFPLMREISWALSLVTSSMSPSSGLPAETCIRVLTRTLFSQIEGSVLAADLALGRRGASDYLPPSDLLRGDHRAVCMRVIETLEAFSAAFGATHKVTKDGVSKILQK